MNWVDLTDMLFCKAFGHFFAIKKPAFRNDVVKWSCVDSEGIILDEGGTVTISTAKSLCKEIYKKLKTEDKSIYVKPSGRLTRKKYARINVG